MKLLISLLVAFSLSGCGATGVAIVELLSKEPPVKTEIKEVACPPKPVTHSCMKSTDPLHHEYVGQVGAGEFFPLPTETGEMNKALLRLYYSRVHAAYHCRGNVIQDGWDAHDECVARISEKAER